MLPLLCLLSKSPIYAFDSGLTNSNYTELTQLYEKYKDKGMFLLTQGWSSFITSNYLLVSDTTIANLKLR